MTMTNECAHDFRCILNHEHPSVGQHTTTEETL
jgi:hypothetical protein